MKANIVYQPATFEHMSLVLGLQFGSMNHILFVLSLFTRVRCGWWMGWRLHPIRHAIPSHAQCICDLTWRSAMCMRMADRTEVPPDPLCEVRCKRRIKDALHRTKECIQLMQLAVAPICHLHPSMDIEGIFEAYLRLVFEAPQWDASWFGQ